MPHNAHEPFQNFCLSHLSHLRKGERLAPWGKTATWGQRKRGSEDALAIDFDATNTKGNSLKSNLHTNPTQSLLIITVPTVDGILWDPAPTLRTCTHSKTKPKRVPPTGRLPREGMFPEITIS